MRNVFRRDDDLSTTIADNLSDSTKHRLRSAADSGQSAIDRGRRAARDLQHSSAVRYVQDNPVKVAGLVILGGLVVYSLFKGKRKYIDERD